MHGETSAPPRYLVVDAADQEKWTGAADEFFVRTLSSLEPVDADEGFEVVRPYAGEPMPQNFEELWRYRGLVLTGSPRSAYEEIPWVHRMIELVRLVARQEKTRLYACCFGHQLVAQALGGVVAKRNGFFVLGSELIRPMDALYGKYVGTSSKLLLKAHGDEVKEAPPCSKVIACSDSTAIESFIVQADGNAETVVIWTLQAHPELTQNALLEKVLPYVRSRLADGGEQSQRQIEDFDTKDAVHVMATIKNFLARGWQHCG
mmetsp:Transcript_6129/g.18518  ORF Transcript_6129/g.18518 Transcript_6129/m.18518 type:complete len:261 (+) Transcript_6129:53-835(+)